MFKTSVQYHLIEIFKAVADTCDGGEECSEDIKQAYQEALADPDIRELYGNLIDLRHEEVFGSHA